VPVAPTPAQADASDVGISCQVCHTGHVGYTAGGDYDLMRRWASGREVGCGDCHNWQFEVLDQMVQSETVDGGVHARPAANLRVRHPQREMLEGDGLWGVGPKANPMPGVECHDCHMPRTHKEGMPADDDGDEEATRMSHRFHVVEPGDAERWRLRPGGDSCTAECHSGEREEYSRAEFQEWIEEQHDEIASRTLEVTSTLGVVAADDGLSAWTKFMSARPSASRYTEAEWAMLQKAAQNADFVINDASGGVHNPEYAKAGLDRALVWARSVAPVLELAAPGGFVDGDEATLTATFEGTAGDIDGAELELQSSRDGGATWSTVRTVSPTSVSFTVLAAPVSGAVDFRLCYRPAEGVEYYSDPARLTAPETQAVLDPSGAAWSCGSVTVTLAGTPGGLTFYSLEGAMVAAPALYTGPFTVSSDGVTTVRYWTADSSGCEAQCSSEVRIDSGAPVVSGSVKSLYAESASIVLSATDPVSGPSQISYTLDGGLPVAVSGGSATVKVTALGAHTLSAFAVDTAGNQSAVLVKSFSVRSTPKVYKSPSGGSYGLKRGSSWKYSATVKRPSGARIAGKKVFLQRSRDGRTWSKYCTLSTNSSGVVAKSITPGVGTFYWRWYVTPDSRYNAASGSATKTVVK
jgi:hypothetical protein